MDAAASTDPFAPEVIEAICRHMNDDHRADSLDICRSLGGFPDARQARLGSISPSGAVFEVLLDEGVGIAHVPWEVEIRTRADVRLAFVHMCDRARQQLATTAPTDPDHEEGP